MMLLPPARPWLASVVALFGLCGVALAGDDQLIKFSNGEAIGGLKDFYLTDQEHAIVADKLMAVPAGVNRWQVLRENDVDFQHCVTAADFGWDISVVKGLIKLNSVAAAVIGQTKWEEADNCNQAWHDKVLNIANATHFQMLDAETSEDPKVLQTLNKILENVGDVKVDVIGVDTNISDIKQRISQLTKDHALLASFLSSQAKEADKIAKARELRDNINAGVQLTQLLSRVAFSNDPAAQYRIKVGTDAIGVIANNVTSLQGGLKTGASIIAGIGIANAAVSMLSMLGPFGQDPTAAMIQEGFSSIRSDIKDLSINMNDRFDRVDHSIEILFSSMQDRFDTVDKHINELVSKLDQMDEENAKKYHTDSAALAALLNQSYLVAYSNCAGPHPETFLSPKDLRNCLSEYKVFATEGAKQAALNGEALFDFRKYPEEAVTNFEEIGIAEQMGYLRSSLVNSNFRTPGDLGRLSITAASPFVWAGIVDAYLHALQVGPELKPAVPLNQMFDVAKADIPALIGAGQNSMALVSALRDDGVSRALSIYRAREKELIAELSRIAVTQAVLNGLDAVAIVDYRDIEAGFYPDANNLRIILKRGEQYIVRNGPAFGKQIVVVHHREFINSPIDISSNAAALVPYYVNMARTSWLNNDALPYGVDQFASASEIETALTQANKSYADTVQVSEFSTRGIESVVDVAGKLPTANDPKVLSACVRLSEAQLYLMRLAMFEREDSGQHGSWVASLAAIPGNATDNDPCEGVVEFFKTVLPDPDLDKRQLLADFYSAWFKHAIDARVDQFEADYKLAPKNGDVAVVESRIKALEAIH